MNPVADLVHQGGPVIVVIMALSVVLYWQCFDLLVSVSRSRPREDRQEEFARRRVTIGAMIAAAPLLGLLGTVSGMARTFESLAENAGQKSMENLAGGISEVLVSTESGLAVAIPALLLVYLAHRAAEKT
ncbi:MAG TPA: MotA/TolQ/ExbB proton channel family protein [Opitutaceae bacterium]|nr:MotA/TolQ/ExbB proton channel family protein [Opitutaceae bacterium]